MIIEYYNLNPSDAVITVESTQSNLFDYTVQETGEGKGEIKIRPLQEIHNQIDIILTAKNPNDNNAVVGTKIIKAKFDYANLNVKVSFVNSDGNFSRYNSDSKILTIGDGENVQLKFEIEEAMANGSIKSISWVPSNSADNSITIGEISSGDGYEIKQISHNEDYMEYQYRILSAVKPSWTSEWKNDLYIVKDYNESLGTKVHIDVKSKTFITSSENYPGYFIQWYSTDGDWGYSTADVEYLYSPPTVNNPDETGRIYTEKEFKNILWYYIPRTSYSHSGGDVTMPEKIWHCEYVREPVSDTKVISSEILGKIIIIITHNGAEQNKIEIPVYLEKRICSKETE